MKKLLILLALCLCSCIRNDNTNRKLVGQIECERFYYEPETRKTHIYYYDDDNELKELAIYVNEWVLNYWYESWLYKYSGNYFVLMYGVKA